MSHIFVRGDMPTDGPSSIELQPLQGLMSQCESDLPECNHPSDLSMLIYTSGDYGSFKGLHGESQLRSEYGAPLPGECRAWPG